MIKREDIHFSYTGSPDTGLELEAVLMYRRKFTMDNDQSENVIQSQKVVFQILDGIYGDVRESLMDILEEYQMAHSKHPAGRSKVQGMIEDLIGKIPV